MNVTAQNETEKQIVKVMQEITSLLILKNRDYGDASFNQGIIGNVIHLDDKISRYKNLVYGSLNGKKPSFESIDDTLRDIIGYSVLGLIILVRSRREGRDFFGLKVKK